MSFPKSIIRFLFVATVLTYSLATRSSANLFDNGETSFVISAPRDAKPEIQFAAKELQQYIFKASGALLPIREQNSSDKYYIFLSADESDSEGFYYHTEGQNIKIHGLGRYGIVNAVYDFLETELGIRWLTPAETFIPDIRSYRLRPIKRTGSPVFSTRLNYYYDALHHPLWCQHNRLNCTTFSSDYPATRVSWWGMHTFNKLLPEETYFAQHPEYFCLRNNKRVKHGQLCLSNPEVLNIVVTSLKKIIREHPEYSVYDVSQNDNNDFCQCGNCTGIQKKYGGLSGLILWFVNQVADSVKTEFPNKLVGTFAYRNTRQAPVGIKARENVVIRFCTFESCIIHGFSDCERNLSIKKDIRQWSAITPHLEVWDYCVGFKQYIAPCPNFPALAERFRAYKKLGVSGILVEGNYEGSWGDFSELRQWVVSKLLWNPSQDADSLAHIFINAYYHEASPYIWEFYRLTQNQAHPSRHFPIYADYKNDVYTNEYIEKSHQILEKARLVTQNNPAVSARVDRVAAQVYYLEATRYPFISPVRIKALARLSAIIKKNPTYFMEYHKDMTSAFHILGF